MVKTYEELSTTIRALTWYEKCVYRFYQCIVLLVWISGVTLAAMHYDPGVDQSAHLLAATVVACVFLGLGFVVQLLLLAKVQIYEAIKDTAINTALMNEQLSRMVDKRAM